MTELSLYIFAAVGFVILLILLLCLIGSLWEHTKEVYMKVI